MRFGRAVRFRRACGSGVEGVSPGSDTDRWTKGRVRVCARACVGVCAWVPAGPMGLVKLGFRDLRVSLPFPPHRPRAIAGSCRSPTGSAIGTPCHQGAGAGAPAPQTSGAGRLQSGRPATASPAASTVRVGFPSTSARPAEARPGPATPRGSYDGTEHHDDRREESEAEPSLRVPFRGPAPGRDGTGEARAR